MTKRDLKTLEMLKQMITEVKQEMATKKLIAESKTPQEVFNKHEKNIKEYVTKKLFETIRDAEK